MKGYRIVVIIESIVIIMLLLFIGRSVFLFGDGRILSYDKSYYTIKVRNDSYTNTMYIITDSEDRDKKYYTELFGTTFSSIKYCWGLKNNDFFLLSSDFGYAIYKYEGGTWNNNYSIQLSYNENNQMIAKLLVISIGANEDIYLDYDIDNIPAPILKYLKSK